MRKHCVTLHISYSINHSKMAGARNLCLAFSMVVVFNEMFIPDDGPK